MGMRNPWTHPPPPPGRFRQGPGGNRLYGPAITDTVYALAGQNVCRANHVVPCSGNGQHRQPPALGAQCDPLAETILGPATASNAGGCDVWPSLRTDMHDGKEVGGQPDRDGRKRRASVFAIPRSTAYKVLASAERPVLTIRHARPELAEEGSPRKKELKSYGAMANAQESWKQLRGRLVPGWRRVAGEQRPCIDQTLHAGERCFT